jgi:hypothetical protein
MHVELSIFVSAQRTDRDVHIAMAFCTMAAITTTAPDTNLVNKQDTAHSWCTFGPTYQHKQQTQE